MSTGYQIKDQEAIYYVTFQIVNWIDIFTRKVYRDIIIDNLRYNQQNKGLEIYAFVIMSNHAHLIIRCGRGRLSDTIREFKSYTAKQILLAIESKEESRSEWMINLFEFAAKKHKRNEKFQIWTHENHAIEINSNAFFFEKMNYIHQNPVQAGWVENAEDYLYSSARFYGNRKCLLDVVQVIPELMHVHSRRFFRQ